MSDHAKTCFVNPYSGRAVVLGGKAHRDLIRKHPTDQRIPQTFPKPHKKPKIPKLDLSKAIKRPTRSAPVPFKNEIDVVMAEPELNIKKTNVLSAEQKRKMQAGRRKKQIKKAIAKEKRILKQFGKVTQS